MVLFWGFIDDPGDNQLEIAQMWVSGGQCADRRQQRSSMTERRRLPATVQRIM